MAKRKGSNTNLAKLGRKIGKTWKDVRENEASESGGLPGDLKGVIGRVKELKLDEYEDGSQYASLAISVIHPEEFAGRTAYAKWVFVDKPYKSLDEVVSKFQQAVGLLTQESDIDIAEYDVEEWGDMAKEITALAPFFRFDTLSWDMEVKDRETGKKKTLTGVAVVVGRALSDEELPEGIDIEGDQMSLSTMAKMADDGNEKMIDALEALAVEYEMDSDEYDDYVAMVDDMPDDEELEAGGDDEPEEEAEADDDIIPEEGDECSHEGEPVTVTAVDEENETCTVQDENGDEWEDIPFTELEWDEE